MGEKHPAPRTHSVIFSNPGGPWRSKLWGQAEFLVLFKVQGPADPGKPQQRREVRVLTWELVLLEARRSKVW